MKKIIGIVLISLTSLTVFSQDEKTLIRFDSGFLPSNAKIYIILYLNNDAIIDQTDDKPNKKTFLYIDRINATDIIEIYASLYIDNTRVGGIKKKIKYSKGVCSQSDIDDYVENTFFKISYGTTTTPYEYKVVLPLIEGRIEYGDSQQKDNGVCKDNTLKIFHHIFHCFLDFEYDITYQVSYDGNLYSDISSLEISSFLPNDFLLNSVFHIRAKVSHGGHTLEYTEGITYTYKHCSPNLLNVEPTAPTCSNSTDGGFDMQLSRELSEGEMLKVNLYQKSEFQNDDGTYYRSYKENTVDELIDKGDDTYNYIWPSAIPSGVYRVKYQTYFKDSEEVDWSKLELSEDFNITPPAPVEFSATKKNDVDCHGENTGSIEITASGGTTPYEYTKDGGVNWIAFNPSGSTIASNLIEGTYNIQVRDKFECQGKTTTNNNAEQSVVIIEPDSISVELLPSVTPTGNGFKNGSIILKTLGGTKPYSFQWQDSNNLIVGTGTTNDTIRLQNVGADSYIVTITDANSCTYTDTFVINEPDALSVTISETNPISCNPNNVDGNPSSDGELTATASGGVPFDPLIDRFYAYQYTWKMKNASGSWETILQETTNILSNRSEGEYAVNIKDAKGIVIGNYVNETLVSTTDVVYTLSPPPLLVIESLIKKDVSCHEGSDGEITATVKGGTGNYTYKWNNGATTPSIVSLVAGKYWVTVTDAKYCSISDTIMILQPESPLTITYTSTQPTSFGATDGMITALVTGGTPQTDGAYSFEWVDGENNNLMSKISAQSIATGYELTLSDVGADTYVLTIKDIAYTETPERENCGIIADTFLLTQPTALSLSITEYQPISCNSTNTYENPSSDGILVAHADGGVVLSADKNEGLLYYYTWKKQMTNGGWEQLPSQNTDTARGLSAGVYAVNIEDANGIVIGTYVNDVLETPNDVNYRLEEPPILSVSLSKQDVQCYSGDDGWITANVAGGTPPYTIAWNNGDEGTRTEQLSTGWHSVHINDSRGCEVIDSIKIEQPTELLVTFPSFSRPSTYGASDGWIKAEVVGGTSQPNGVYDYAWVNTAGEEVTVNSQFGIEEGVFTILLNNVFANTYSLSVYDAHYDEAITKTGCSIINKEISIYDPIEASIAIADDISCNQVNTFDNPYSDGLLRVEVRGGHPFDSGLPYRYYWKKQNAEGNFETLLGQNQATATDLSTGVYALNVEDALGAVIGVYESDNLLNATDVVYEFNEPALLTVSLSSTPVDCDAGNNGTANATIMGGIPPYTVEWSNGMTSTAVSELIGGIYTIYVIDNRGCEVTGQVTVDQPSDIRVSLETKNPTCFQGKDGRIVLSVQGGKPPYTYTWENGETTASIATLTADTYTCKITDSNECVFYQAVNLTEPAPVIVDAGADRVLCNEQSHTIDISLAEDGASYLWQSSNGFSDNNPIVTLTEAGVYIAQVITKEGCIGMDTVVITTNDIAVDAQFLVPSQVYAKETITLINTSNPLSENVDWIMETGIKVLSRDEHELTLWFEEAGVYKITLKAYQGECYEEYVKDVIVNEARANINTAIDNGSIVRDFEIYPNPSNGTFSVTIKLNEAAPIELKVFNLVSNHPLDKKEGVDKKEYTMDYQMPLTTGIYFIVLQVSGESIVRKIIIQ